MIQTEQQARPEGPSVFDMLGGESGVRRLVDQFYDLMDIDADLSVLRHVHGADLDQARDKLFWYLCGYFGGPQHYIERFGHPRLRARHMPFSIGMTERDQWLLCMARAMQALDYPEALSDKMLEIFSGSQTGCVTARAEAMSDILVQEVDQLVLADRIYRVDHALTESCEDGVSIWDYFDPQTTSLRARRVTEGGRAAAWFVRVGAFDAVLRLYRRGGLAARFVKDRYLWLGVEHTRSSAEFDLLSTMWRAGLSVPRPLGAAAWRQGLTYRAALLTECIPAARPLAHNTELAVWTRAGAAIAQMHRFDVWHADLNVFNILYDPQGKVWLIDFDRSRRGNLTPGQRTENLSRLLRSVKKLSLRRQDDYWQALLEGYDATTSL